MMDSQEPFDPYLKWLGIRDPERPPNHYRLLGLELFESDPDVIATSADRQMAHVRRFQHGARVELSQQILNQLAAAKVCLLRRESKAEYDGQLRQAIERGDVSARPIGGPGPRAVHGARRRYLLAAGIAGLSIVACAVLSLLWRLPPEAVVRKPAQPTGAEASSSPPARHPRPSAPSGEVGPAKGVVRTKPSSGEERPGPAAGESRPVEAGRPAAESHGPSSAAASDDSAGIHPLSPLSSAAGVPRLRRAGEAPRQAIDPRSLAPARPVKPTVPPSAVVTPEEDPEEIALTGLDVGSTPSSPGTFSRLRMAMQSRDLEQAEILIEKLKGESTSYPQREAAERLWLVVFQLKQFWNAVRGGLTFMKPGLKLSVAGEAGQVVEVTANEVVFQIGEARKAMAIERRTIDSGLAMTLATLHFMQLGASPQPALAAFLAVDGSGNPRLAAEIWRDLRHRNMATPLPVRESQRVIPETP